MNKRKQPEGSTAAAQEFVFKDEGKEKAEGELMIANLQLSIQNREKEKRAAELIVANKEVIYEKKEKGKRAAELIIANKELLFQNQEKEKRAAELVIANIELAFQNQEKEKRAAELIVANKELIFQNTEKEKRAAELITAYNRIKKAEEFSKQYISDLEKMMFMTHHKVRQPVANILGISNLLSQPANSAVDQKKLVDYMIQSALDLDTFTKELTKFIADMEKKGKEKK